MRGAFHDSLREEAAIGEFFFRALEDSIARKERFWATVRDRYFSGVIF